MKELDLNTVFIVNDKKFVPTQECFIATKCSPVAAVAGNSRLHASTGAPFLLLDRKECKIVTQGLSPHTAKALFSYAYPGNQECAIGLENQGINLTKLSKLVMDYEKEQAQPGEDPLSDVSTIGPGGDC